MEETLRTLVLVHEQDAPLVLEMSEEVTVESPYWPLE